LRDVMVPLLGPGMDVWRHSADSDVLSRRPCFPQGDTVHIPRRHRSHY